MKAGWYNGTAKSGDVRARGGASQLFAGGQAAGLFPVGNIDADRPVGKRTGHAPVRPRGQDRAAHRCGPDLFRLRTHPAGHGAAGAGCPAARPADQRQSAHRAGGFGVLHLPARSAQTLPRPVPAGGAGAVHRHCRRDAAPASSPEKLLSTSVPSEISHTEPEVSPEKSASDGI